MPKDISRRRAIAATAALAAVAKPLSANAGDKATALYGLIGQMIAVPGGRDALSAILLDGTRDMPGCLSYVIADDVANPDALWITEVWKSKADHGASLNLPSVQAAIAKGRPLIAGFGTRTETTPVGGWGLAS